MKLLLLLLGLAVAVSGNPISSPNVVDSPQFPPMAQFVEAPTKEELEQAGMGCNVQKYSTCGQAYFKKLGFSSIPTDPWAFMAQLQKIARTQGAQGFAMVCRAGAQMIQCMGGMQAYNACFNVPTYVKVLKVPYNLAVMWISIGTQMGYQCGPGYNILLNNFKCVTSTMVVKNATLQNCLQTYINNLKKDPSHVCKYAQQYATCFSTPFSQACGKAVGFVQCSSMVVAFQRFIACPFNCGGGSFSHVLSRADVITSAVELAPPQSEPQAAGEEEKEVGAPEPVPCDATRFQTCVQQYGTALGVTITGDPADFANQLQKWLMGPQGQAHFATLCHATHVLFECLGPQLDTCVSVQYLMQQGLSHANAVAWVAIKNEFGYECGPAYHVIHDNWKCIFDTEKKSGVYLKKCLDTFLDKIKKDPTQVCPASQEYLRCFSKPFGTACKPAVAQTMCEVIAMSFHTTWPKCHYNCSMQTSLAVFIPEQVAELVVQEKKKAAAPPAESAVAEPPQSCQPAKFEQCSSEFSVAIGLGSSMPADPMKFIEMLQKMMMGKMAFVRFQAFCMSLHEYSACLGLQESSCFTVEFLTQIGLTVNNAHLYIALKNELSYECGPGYHVLIQNFKCIQSVDQGSQAIFKKCMDTFTAEMRKSPTKFCDHAQEFINCYIGPFKKCPAEVGATVCRAISINLHSWNPQCTYTCPKAESDPNFLAIPPPPEQSMAQVPGPAEVALAEPVPCNPTTFAKCTNTFAVSIGIGTIPADPMAFIKYIQDMMLSKAGKIKFEAFCMAMHEYFACLGEQADSCFTTQFLMREGITANNAMVFISFKNQLRYECGAGYHALINDYTCIQTVSKASEKLWYQCLQTYIKELKEEPSKYCAHSQEYLTCYLNPFKKCTPTARAALCQTLKIGLHTYNPKCQLTCPA